MLLVHFIVNKVRFNYFYTNYIASDTLFMPNYLSFGYVFP
jgi:hypothetical protein